MQSKVLCIQALQRNESGENWTHNCECSNVLNHTGALVQRWKNNDSAGAQPRQSFCREKQYLNTKTQRDIFIWTQSVEVFFPRFKTVQQWAVMTVCLLLRRTLWGYVQDRPFLPLHPYFSSFSVAILFVNNQWATRVNSWKLRCPTRPSRVHPGIPSVSVKSPTVCFIPVCLAE